LKLGMEGGMKLVHPNFCIHKSWCFEKNLVGKHFGVGLRVALC